MYAGSCNDRGISKTGSEICSLYCSMGILVLFGVGLGVALNQIRSLQKRIQDLEDFIGETFFDKEE